jgi:hypothetical protein
MSRRGRPPGTVLVHGLRTGSKNEFWFDEPKFIAVKACQRDHAGLAETLDYRRIRRAEL